MEGHNLIFVFSLGWSYKAECHCSKTGIMQGTDVALLINSHVVVAVLILEGSDVCLNWREGKGLLTSGLYRLALQSLPETRLCNEESSKRSSMLTEYR